jgi:predicted unusual protein kinase regulating ubiquinone biosynthesis (AarF/ABC1/UbiB family)
LRRLDGLRSSIAVDGDPEVALQAFVARARQWEQERLARRDRIEMAELPIPEILEDRAPLMQFIGTRYYLELPIGERRGLMRELEADPDRAMLRFFELTGLHKVGQFLSNWPEVPDTIQAELAELQDNVAPSNWEDVEGTIVRIFGDAHGQWIVDHIVPDPETGNRCHKAGTIGEVYLVRDESGTMHVLKVIPQTKYDKVERALERLEAVKGRMASHPSIEGSPTAIRIIDRIMTTIRRELDLTRDIHNAAEFRAQLAALPPALRERLIVPTFDLEHQHPQGILMSFEAGHRVDDVTAVSAEDAHAACALLHELLLRAMMQHTWIPEDLHPGNFFVRRRSAAPGDVNVVILDFGRMVQTLEWERARVRSFIETLFHGRDNEAWLQAVERMGKITLQYEPTDLGHRITEIQHEAAMTSVDSVFAVVQQLLFAAGRFGLEVRGTYLELIKAMSSFNGTTARIAQVHGVPTAWAMNATMTFLQIVQELKDNARTMREEERVRNRNLSHQEASATVRRILMDYGVRELEKYAETINRLVQLFRREAGSMTLMATYLTRLGIVPEDREACIEDIRDEIG